MVVFGDTLDALKELQGFAALCNLFIHDVNICIGLPFVGAKSSVLVIPSRSQKFVRGPVSDLV